MTCKPVWYDELNGPVRDLSNQVGSLAISGCAINSSGIVPCTPESMRLTVEAYLRARGVPMSLDLDEYALARNVASEADPGASVLEKVALAEAAVNRYRRDGSRRGWKSLGRMLMRDQQWFSSQRGTNPPAATSKDPEYEDIIIAQKAIGGWTWEFVRGAVLYFSPKHQGSSTVSTYESWTSGGAMWVGNLPGISSRDQMFFVEKYSYVGTEQWRRMHDAGLAELSSPTPVAEVNRLAPCRALAVSRSQFVMLASVGGVAAIGLTALARRGRWAGG